MTVKRNGTKVLNFTVIASVLLALACSSSPSGVREISQDGVLAEPSSTLILDVRSPDEFASGHVPNAVNIPHDQLAGRLSEIDQYREESVVVYCESGRRAGSATSVLQQAGFTKLFHLTGDMSGWRGRKLPTETSGS
jgi:phage shock protein E